MQRKCNIVDYILNPTEIGNTFGNNLIEEFVLEPLELTEEEWLALPVLKWLTVSGVAPVRVPSASLPGPVHYGVLDIS